MYPDSEKCQQRMAFGNKVATVGASTMLSDNKEQATLFAQSVLPTDHNWGHKINVSGC